MNFYAFGQRLKREAGQQATSLIQLGNDASIVRDVNRRILMAVAIIAILAVTISYFLLLNATKGQLEDKADEYIDTISEALSPALWTVDQQSAQSIAQAFANNDELAYILVTRPRVSEFVVVGSAGVDMIFRQTEVFFNEQAIGEVRIGLTTAPLQQKARGLLWLSLGIVLVVLVALFMSIRYFLQTSLQHPLAVVLDRIQQIEEGHYAQATTGRIPIFWVN